MSTGQRSGLGLLLELLTIIVGVFLGSAAEQWRADRADRASARAALVAFRTELAHNRDAVLARRAYHCALADSLGRFLGTPGPHTMVAMRRQSGFQGIRSVEFEHTAYDLALATQALAHVDPELAYQLERVYTRQAAFEAIERGFLTNAFTPATFANPDAYGFGMSMSSYLGDVNVQEPMLLAMYATVLPALDRAVGGRPPNETRPAAGRAAPTCPETP